MWLLAAIVLLSTPAQQIQLDTRETLVINPGIKMAVNRDGTFILISRNRLFHWDQAGKLINVIDGKKTPYPIKFIMSFYYDEHQGTYWILDGPSIRSLFFDRKAAFIGLGFLDGETQNPEQIYFRDLVTAGRRIMAVEYGFNENWDLAPGKVIRFVKYKIEDKGVRISLLGKKFGQFTHEQRQHQYNYKRNWPVQVGFSKQFLLVNQVTPFIQHFSGPQDGAVDDGLSFKEFGIQLFMPHWVESPKKGLALDEFDNYSKITGFFSVKDGLVLGYTIPDAQKEELGDLGLQKLDFKGNPKGVGLRTKGFFMGIYRNQAYVLRTEPGDGDTSYFIDVFNL